MELVSPGDLRRFLIDAMELGAKKTLVELGLLPAFLSKQEAYKKYGRKQVDRWIKEKLVKPIKDGTNTSKVRISRTEIETVAMTSNRMSWFTHYVPEEE